jgi:hypothetical protein
MLPLTPTQIERIARLIHDPDFAVVRAWLRDSEIKMTANALRSANPQQCGAAAVLQDLNAVLDSLPDLYHSTRKTPDGSAFS